eukprot:1161902-Pelagomonas_calceolata.AAC.17
MVLAFSVPAGPCPAAFPSNLQQSCSSHSLLSPSPAAWRWLPPVPDEPRPAAPPSPPSGSERSTAGRLGQSPARPWPVGTDDTIKPWRHSQARQPSPVCPWPVQ